MSDSLRYTTEEITLIDAVIGTLYPRMADPSLQDAYLTVHQHLVSGSVCAIDLKRIESALELADPGQCTSFHKEDYRDYTQLRVKTRAMLRNA
jgi:hypothetical protein